MENKVTIHHNRYLYQFEIIITLLAIGLIIFGLYDLASGQTNADYGQDTRVTNRVLIPASGPRGDLAPVDNFVGSRETASQYFNTGGNQNQTTSGGGTATGGTGANTNNTIRTQGTYISTKNSGIYNFQGLVEGGPVPTAGTTLGSTGQSVFNPKSINEQNNLSAKNCEFITKYHKFGDRGGDVPKIQQFLKDRGYYNGRIDGVYGIGTFRAVRNFQKDYKDKILDPWEFDNRSSVEGTGVTNVSTKYAINKMVGCPDPATIVPKTGRVLNY